MVAVIASPATGAADVCTGAGMEAVIVQPVSLRVLIEQLSRCVSNLKVEVEVE